MLEEFTIHPADFALHHALSAVPETVVETERLVATAEERVIPYFWAVGGDRDRFESVLELCSF